MTKLKIGLPKGLLYYKYNILWKNFFQNLGCEVIVSPTTTKEILKKGVSLSIDESCLSFKLFLGHVDYLIDKVDYLFIPRIASLYEKDECCSKFMGLYDIVKNTFDNINILELNIDIKKGNYEFNEFLKLGFKLTKNPIKIIKAYKFAKKEYKRHLDLMIEEQKKTLNNNNLKILIVSHPYTTYDGFLGKPVVSFLESQGISVIYSDRIDSNEAKLFSKNISDSIYWTFHKEMLGAIEKYKNKIHGILFLSTFPCGPDALVIDICTKKIKNIPIVVITMDDQEGDAGLKTRLESFTDILKMKINEKN
jgi:predicted nucleotide-binding protein (sugar kinase/HSP70/actin superfamily)